MRWNKLFHAGFPNLAGKGPEFDFHGVADVQDIGAAQGKKPGIGRLDFGQIPGVPMKSENVFDRGPDFELAMENGHEVIRCVSILQDDQGGW
jgi:hypothetical protein